MTGAKSSAILTVLGILAVLLVSCESGQESRAKRSQPKTLKESLSLCGGIKGTPYLFLELCMVSPNPSQIEKMVAGSLNSY